MQRKALLRLVAQLNAGKGQLQAAVQEGRGLAALSIRAKWLPAAAHSVSTAAYAISVQGQRRLQRAALHSSSATLPGW